MTGSSNVQSDPELLRSFIARIRGKRAEARVINEAIREIYAEAKAAGLNKTVLGEVVAFIEKREKDPDALAERSALFDRYLADNDGTKPATHAHAPEVDAATSAQPSSPATPGLPAATAVAQIAGQAFTIKRPSRPEGCRNPDLCASSVVHQLCYVCGKAAASSTTHLDVKQHRMLTPDRRPILTP